jgi:cytochrome c556
MTRTLQSHAIANLRYEGGTIWDAKSERAEYMALPAIAVQKDSEPVKISAEKLPVFGFRLSKAIDRPWMLFFPRFSQDRQTFLQPPDWVAIECQPDELEAKYKLLKTAVNETNAAYQTERDAVIDAIAELRAHTIHDARATEEQQKKAQERLDSLQL